IDDVKSKTNHEEFVKAVRDLQIMIYDKGATFIPIVSPYSFTLYQSRVKAIPEGIGASALYVNTFYLDKA
ncbi:MAG: hypothetical protein AAB349_00280, partial [Chloroflexota bacterium]